jgi:hypothetical protein
MRPSESARDVAGLSPTATTSLPRKAIDRFASPTMSSTPRPTLAKPRTQPGDRAGGGALSRSSFLDHCVDATRLRPLDPGGLRQDAVGGLNNRQGARSIEPPHIGEIDRVDATLAQFVVPAEPRFDPIPSRSSHRSAEASAPARRPRSGNPLRPCPYLDRPAHFAYASQKAKLGQTPERRAPVIVQPRFRGTYGWSRAWRPGPPRQRR